MEKFGILHKAKPMLACFKSQWCQYEKSLCLLNSELDITGIWFLTLKSTWFWLVKDNPKSWV